jgi:hypothetical protein
MQNVEKPDPDWDWRKLPGTASNSAKSNLVNTDLFTASHEPNPEIMELRVGLSDSFHT